MNFLSSEDEKISYEFIFECKHANSIPYNRNLSDFSKFCEDMENHFILDQSEILPGSDFRLQATDHISIVDENALRTPETQANFSDPASSWNCSQIENQMSFNENTNDPELQSWQLPVDSRTVDDYQMSISTLDKSSVIPAADSFETHTGTASGSDIVNNCIINQWEICGNQEIHNNTTAELILPEISSDDIEIPYQHLKLSAQNEKIKGTLFLSADGVQMTGLPRHSELNHAKDRVESKLAQSEPVMESISKNGALVGQSGGSIDELIHLNRQLDHPFLVNHTAEELVSFMSVTGATENYESQMSINWHDRTKETIPKPVLEDCATVDTLLAESQNNELNPMLIACKSEEEVNNFFENQLNSSMLGIGGNRKRKRPKFHTLEELRDVVVPQIEALLRHHETIGSSQKTIETIREVLRKRRNNIHGHKSKMKKKKETASAISIAAITEQDLKNKNRQNKEMREFFIYLTMKSDVEVAKSVKKEIYGMLRKK